MRLTDLRCTNRLKIYPSDWQPQKPIALLKTKGKRKGCFLEHGTIFYSKNLCTSFSLQTEMPDFRKHSAVMPSPLITLLLKVPSYMYDEPHDGLRSFNIAEEHLYRLANMSTPSAPFMNCSVTSRLSRVTARPFRNSTDWRGVHKPPICSGQTGIK